MTSFAKFRAPHAFDKEGRVIPHAFAYGEPEYAACMDCGGARHAKVAGEPLHPLPR